MVQGRTVQGFNTTRGTHRENKTILCEETVWNTGTAHMDSYPNPHQKSHSIHIQVIFQEVTVLCLYIYVFLSFKTSLFCFSITLFCNYLNYSGVYNYKNFNEVWEQISQVNFILHFLSPALSQSQSYNFLLYPSSISSI